jgi:ribonucleoside-triphosphate reductase
MNDMITEYLEHGTGRENANENFSNSGMQSYIAGKIMAEDYINASPLRDLHKKRLVHVHDARGGRFLPYCCGLSLSKLLTFGLANPTGSSSKPAKHFDTAMSHIGNMLGISQQEFSGAQAFSSVDTYLSAFIRYDGLEYDDVKQAWQQVIYDLNFPRREGYQTVFCNLSFDLKCPEHMKNDYAICGGEPQPEKYSEFQPEMDMCNMAFLDVMMEGDRYGKPFSFPIPTYYATPTTDWDSPVVNRIFELAAKFGLPYFSNSIGTGHKPGRIRSQCCLAGNTKIISKSSRGINYATINELDRTNSIEVLINGEFEPATWFRTTCNALHKITFANGQSAQFSPDHPCITRRGEVSAEDITIDDWMPFSLIGYEGRGGSYDLGKFIGLYIAEGSHKDSGIVFSLNADRSDLMDFVMKFASDYYGAYSSISKLTSPISGKHTCVNVNIYSSTIEAIVDEYVKGRNAIDKHLSSKVFKMSKAFRQGVFDGEFLGDGSSRRRVCTVSKQLAEDFCCLISSLGSVAGVTVDNRDSSCGKLGDNPLYLVRPYTINRTRPKYGGVYEIDGDQIWIKVKSIDVSHEKRSVYDFEMDTEEHTFQLANGLITHNCRLSLDMEEVQQMFDTTGRGIWDLGDSTGSIAVTTINMGQVGYHCKDEAEVIRMLDNYILPPIKEHHIWKRECVEWGLTNGLFPFTRNYLANFITYFSTVCIVGMNEGCLNLYGKPIHECQDFVVNVLTHLRGRLREFCLETGFLWNMEEAPAEGISHSLAKWDKARYPDCIVQGDGDGVYYTNSSHSAVGEGISIAEEIGCQEKFKPIYNGGVLQHLFIGEGSPDPMGVKDLIRNICTNTKIPYIAFTKSYAICERCGMTSDLTGTCPKCNGVTDVFSRVTGYYRSTRKYSDGKKAEFDARTQHTLKEFST